MGLGKRNYERIASITKAIRDAGRQWGFTTNDQNVVTFAPGQIVDSTIRLPTGQAKNRFQACIGSIHVEEYNYYPLPK